MPASNISSLVLFLAISFATYRLARLLPMEEEGPFGAGLFILHYIKKMPATWLQRGLLCTNCTSFWVSLILCILFGVGGQFTGSTALVIAGVLTLLFGAINVILEPKNAKLFIYTSPIPMILLLVFLGILLFSFTVPGDLLAWWLGTAGLSAWMGNNG